MSIQFFFVDTSITLTNRKLLKQFLEDLFIAKHKRLSSLTFIFCTDDYLLDINKQFLAHDYYTDIITFNLAADNLPIEGEIYISIDRVKENASLHLATQKQELHRVIFHGALHLCGYKDKSPKDKSKMTAAEDECLLNYFS